MTHLAITIGPIYKTIKQARSTREIWASSFIFSLMMKAILRELMEHSKVATILAPDIEGIDSTDTYHGAGIYPDRCYVELNAAFSDQEMSDFRNKVYSSLPNGLGIHKDYFHIYAVQAKFSAERQASPLEKDNIIFQLTKVLEDAELQQKFIQSGAPNMIKRLDSAIADLYEAGMAKEDTVFIPGWKGQKPRLPSLIEISTQGLSDKSYYANTVTAQIWQNIRLSKEQQAAADESVLADLKFQLKKEEITAFKARYKYYAIVQSDGDSVGKIIAEMGNNATPIRAFSQKLMTFSKAAANKIADFGAIPVYIGGDDLLFIAPLVNAAEKSIFTLIKELSESFEEKLPSATLSFGLAINYYKHPMSKALSTSYTQLFYAAKKLETDSQKKNALAFLVRKHSGQHFGTMLPKGGVTFGHFIKMVDQYDNLETTFLSATMYTLLAQEFLFMNALTTGRIAHFFEHNFNEKEHKDNKAFAFLMDVKKLAELIHQDLKEVKPTETWKNYLPEKEGLDLNASAIIVNTIFSCLRLIQFLNANDHE